MSAEPPTAAWVQGKRWEDLIEAATSATEADDDRDLTPVCSSIPSFFFLCFVLHGFEEIHVSEGIAPRNRPTPLDFGDGH
jgi:hypothetical protein